MGNIIAYSNTHVYYTRSDDFEVHGSINGFAPILVNVHDLLMACEIVQALGEKYEKILAVKLVRVVMGCNTTNLKEAVEMVVIIKNHLGDAFFSWLEKQRRG